VNGKVGQEDRKNSRHKGANQSMQRVQSVANPEDEEQAQTRASRGESPKQSMTTRPALY
jgi:hypothetical protein